MIKEGLLLHPFSEHLILFLAPFKLPSELANLQPSIGQLKSQLICLLLVAFLHFLHFSLHFGPCVLRLPDKLFLALFVHPLAGLNFLVLGLVLPDSHLEHSDLLFEHSAALTVQDLRTTLPLGEQKHL